MACTSDEEWTIHMVNDQTGSDDIIIFCLNIRNGVVTGSVTDEEGNPLSTDTRVKGIRVPIGALNIHVSTGEVISDFLTLRFRWDKGPTAIKVLLMGSTYRDANDLNKFEGRFLAYLGQLTVADSSRFILAGPDTGETGTGNGTQT